jgi:hypothetical protein
MFVYERAEADAKGFAGCWLLAREAWHCAPALASLPPRRQTDAEWRGEPGPVGYGYGSVLSFRLDAGTQRVPAKHLGYAFRPAPPPWPAQHPVVSTLGSNGSESEQVETDFVATPATSRFRSERSRERSPYP